LIFFNFRVEQRPDASDNPDTHRDRGMVTRL
jgi:hypothetical protein